MVLEYNYTYDSIELKTTRDVGKEYPDIDALDRGIANNKSGTVLLALVNEVYLGKAHVHIIQIEESWWVEQENIQDTTTVIAEVDRLVSATHTDETGMVVDYTADELTANKELLVALLDKHNAIDAGQLVLDLGTSVVDSTTARDLLEATSPWLVSYRGVDTIEVRHTPEYVLPKAVVNKIIAHSRDMEVRDAEGSIADLAKMNSLLFSMVAGIYGTLSTTAKSKLPAAERGLIEHAITRFGQVQTRADRQLVTEGTLLIDKLFDREVAIADIIDRTAV